MEQASSLNTASPKPSSDTRRHMIAARTSVQTAIQVPSLYSRRPALHLRLAHEECVRASSADADIVQATPVQKIIAGAARQVVIAVVTK